jgi:hypothetical protein
MTRQLCRRMGRLGSLAYGASDSRYYCCFFGKHPNSNASLPDLSSCWWTLWHPFSHGRDGTIDSLLLFLIPLLVLPGLICSLYLTLPFVFSALFHLLFLLPTLLGALLSFAKFCQPPFGNISSPYAFPVASSRLPLRLHLLPTHVGPAYLGKMLLWQRLLPDSLPLLCC